MNEDNLYNENAEEIKNILNSISKARKITLKEKNTVADEKLVEIEAVIESFEVFLKSADPLLISSTYKSSISTTLSQIPPYLQNFINDPITYLSHLDSAYSQIEGIKNLFPYLITNPGETGVENIRKTISATRQSASIHLRNLSTEFEEKISDLLKQVEDLGKLSTETKETIKSQKDRLDTAIAEFQKQFSERISDYQKQFSESEEERRKKVESSMQLREKSYKKETDEMFKELNSWRDEFNSNFIKDKEDFNQNSQGLIEQLRGYAQEAKVTVGLMSEKSLQNDFIIQADKEKDRAWWWNFATFLAVGLLLLAIGYIFVHTIIVPLPPDQSSYPQILSKFLVTGVIGIVARWTSRQANRHLAEERRLRKLSLELATINPFLNNLPDEIQFKVKELLAMKYYGNGNEEKAPFGEITPIHDGESGIKSMPETLIDSIRGKK